MAHKGKIYPVLYRRDMNLNRPNNSVGWAKYYRTFFSFNSLGLGMFLSGLDFDCGPDTYPAIDTIVWQSKFKRHGAEFYQLTLTAKIVGGRGFDRTARYDEVIAGKVLELKYPRATDPDQSGWLPGALCQVTFWNDNFFDFEPRFVQGFPFDLRWTEFPPE